MMPPELSTAAGTYQLNPLSISLLSSRRTPKIVPSRVKVERVDQIVELAKLVPLVCVEHFFVDAFLEIEPSKRAII